MHNTGSNWFNSPGYIPLKEYVDDIERMRKEGPWRLPIGVFDRIQLFFLSMVVKFSWFSSLLYVEYPYVWSPAYGIILSYLRREGLLDDIEEKNANVGGKFSFCARKSIYINERTRIISGQGIGSDSSLAFSKALGEIIERMISGLYDMNKEILTDFYLEVARKNQVFYPVKYHRFLDIQKESYRELQSKRDIPIDWVLGKNLITREKTYIPRQMTSWFGFGSARVFKNVLVHSTSNGCAGYFTREGAVLRGLLEVISRDAFLVHWLTMIPPGVIDQETLPKGVLEMIREFESRGVVLYVLDVTTLHIPSVCVVAISEESSVPRIAVSGASAVTFEQAITDSLEEMVILFSEIFQCAEGESSFKPEPTVLPFISSMNKNRRPLYWRGKERVSEFEWFISGPSIGYNELYVHDLKSEDEQTDDKEKLKMCLSVLEKQGEDYYPLVYFPQHPSQKALGFYVAQVYIPKAFPLYLLECYGTFDSDRLEEFVVSREKRDWVLNSQPHPFF